MRVKFIFFILVFFTVYSLSEALDNKDQDICNLTFIIEDDRGKPVEGAVIKLIEEYNIIVEEDFSQENFPPYGWTRYQLGSTDINWERTTDYMMHGTASASVDFSASSYLDNWLVMPQILSVQADLSISLWQADFYGEKYNYHGLWVSTGSGNPGDGDFIELAELNDLSIGFRPTDISLAAYEGQDIYIAFVYQGLDADRWFLDAVWVTYPTAQLKIADAEGIAVFENLLSGLYYYNISSPGYSVRSGNVELSGSDAEVYPMVYTLSDTVISLKNPGNTGLYRYRYSATESEWEKISSDGNALKITAGDITGDNIPEIIVLFGGEKEYSTQLYLYDIYGKTWMSIGDPLPDRRIIDFTLKKSQASNIIVISYEGSGIWEYYPSDGMPAVNISGFDARKLITANFNQADNDELLVVFSEYQGVYLYNASIGSWTRLTALSPSQVIASDITGDGIKELICAFEGLGTYIAYYQQGSRDILQDSWQWNRITFAVPDEGHNIASLNLHGNSGQWILLTHDGKTCYYDCKELSWHLFVHAPLDNIVSGRFNDINFYTIIALESTGGNLYLYSPRDNRWKVLLHNVHPNLITVLE